MKNIIIYLFALMISNIYAQCDDYGQSQCDNDNSCEWVENIESVTCASLVWDEELCEAAPDCTYSCWDAGGYFGWCEPECTGGMAYINNSYCQEMEILECSEMDEMECGNEDSCDWTENIEWGSCYDLDPIWNVVYYCDDPSTNSDNCYTYTCYGGGYGQWGTCCGGDPYIISDNSYCEDIPYALGDVNQDSIINIQDVIIIVNLVLNEQIDPLADINDDHNINVLDIIELVNRILNN